jgi:hypothetical protein
VAHACNPSYSRGRDREDHGSKPARANSEGVGKYNRVYAITGNIG